MEKKQAQNKPAILVCACGIQGSFDSDSFEIHAKTAGFHRAYAQKQAYTTDLSSLEGKPKITDSFNRIHELVLQNDLEMATLLGNEDEVGVAKIELQTFKNAAAFGERQKGYLAPVDYLLMMNSNFSFQKEFPEEYARLFQMIAQKEKELNAQLDIAEKMIRESS